MCDSLTFKYRIEGSPRVLQKFVKTIQEYRVDCGNGMDGLRCPIYDHMDGSLSWAGWQDSLMGELDGYLCALTRRNATRIWAYHGEANDDYRYGCVRRFGKGEVHEAGHWDSDVGFDAAMAAIELQNSKSFDAAMLLVKKLEWECARPGRLSAVLAQMVLEAMVRHPSLAMEGPIWSRVTELRSQISASNLTSETAGGDREMDPNRIGWLFAKIEAGKLLAGLAATTGEACPPKVARL